MFGFFRPRLMSETEASRVRALLARVWQTQEPVIDGDEAVLHDPIATDLAIRHGLLSSGSFWMPVYTVTAKGERFLGDKLVGGF